MLEKGEGGTRDSEEALSYLKESAGLGNEPAAYEYAQRLYAEAYKIFKENLHTPRKALTFISRLPKPL
jgi:TPR repeat protein